MQKTLRIFRKDTRHLWPEILLTLALTLSFALTAHYFWHDDANDGFRQTDTLTLVTWIDRLMPLGWWLLIARAVHDESLVGDLQFWVTRPYGWRRVLAAKLLFIATFILVPFFLAQCYLLHQAGLHPLVVLPGLLLKLLLLFAFILLPLLALSTVTASLTRMLFVFIGLVVYISAIDYFVRLLLPTGSPWAPGSDRFAWMQYSVLFIPAVAVAVTLLQYARRRTLVSTCLLCGLVLLSTVALIAVTRQGNVEEYTPLAADRAPLQISLNTDPSAYSQPYNNGDASTQLNADKATPRSFNRLNLPVVFSAIAPGHAIDFEGSTFSVVDSNGTRHDSVWANNLTIYIAPQQINQPIDFADEAYKFPVGKAIAVHLTYAIADYQADPPTIVTFNGKSMDIPSRGRCQLATNLECQYPLRSPYRTLVTWHLQQQCGASSPTDELEQQWIGEDEPMLNPTLDPVVSDVTLTTETYSERHDKVRLCPGTKFTFTSYHLVGRHRIEVTLSPIDPQNYGY